MSLNLRFWYVHDQGSRGQCMSTLIYSDSIFGLKMSKEVLKPCLKFDVKAAIEKCTGRGGGGEIFNLQKQLEVVGELSSSVHLLALRLQLCMMSPQYLMSWRGLGAWTEGVHWKPLALFSSSHTHVHVMYLSVYCKLCRMYLCVLADGVIENGITLIEALKQGFLSCTLET